KQSHITVRIESLLPENVTNQKIRERTKSRDADFFALEILHSFDLRFDDHRMNDSGQGVSEDDKIGTGKTRINDRRSRYRSHLNAAANHRFRGFSGPTHSHRIGIKTVLLEELGLFSNVNDDVPHADGRDADIYLLERLRLGCGTDRKDKQGRPNHHRIYRCS